VAAQDTTSQLTFFETGSAEELERSKAVIELLEQSSDDRRRGQSAKRHRSYRDFRDALSTCNIKPGNADEVWRHFYDRDILDLDPSELLEHRAVLEMLLRHYDL
jgi:hypothetical protein